MFFATLIPMVNLVTPNQLEFELSTGHRASTLDSVLAQLLIAGVH